MSDPKNCQFLVKIIYTIYMEHLFAYGELAILENLKKIIGRDAAATTDRLFGYKLIENMISAGVDFTAGIELCDESFVDGVVYDLYLEELSLIDQQFSGVHERKRVRLESGNDAYVYIPDHID
jgi:hypothetical protein